MPHPRVMLAVLVAIMVLPHAARAQAGCEPIMTTMATELKEPTWHRTVEMKTGSGTMRIEMIKVGEQIFRRMGATPWQKMPMTAATLNEMGGQMLASGKLKLSACRRVGEEVVGGVRAGIFEYTSTLEGVPKPYTARVWIGVSDSLPYKIVSDTLTQSTVYKGVTVPK